MRNEFFIERYAHEKHQTHLREAALERQGRTSSASVRHLGRRTIRSPAATALSLIGSLVGLAHRQVVGQVGCLVRTILPAHGR